MKLRLTTQVGLLTAARALGQILNALIGILVVRRLSQFDYGTFRQIFLIVATLVQTELGFVESLYYFLPSAPQMRCFFLRQTLAVVGTTQVLAGMLMVIFAQPIASFFNNPGLVDCMKLLALYSGFSMLTRIWEVELVADKRVPMAAAVSFGFEALKVGLMALSLLMFSGLRPVLLALVIVAGLKFVSFGIFLIREFGFLSAPGSVQHGMAQLRYAMALWIPAILNGAIGGQAHQYIVGHYFSPSEYAIYAVACFQVPFVAILTNSIAEIVVVRATEFANQGKLLDLYQLWINASRKGLLLYIGISMGLSILARPIIAILFTDRYRASASLFSVMVLGFLSYGVFQDALFRACRAMKTYAVFYALRAILGVGLAFAGLKLWGLWGVALSTVVAIGMVNIVQLVPAARLLGVSFARVLPWRDIGKMLLAVAAATLLTWALCQQLGNLSSLLIGFPVFAVTYGGLAIRLGVIGHQEVTSVLHELGAALGQTRIFRRSTPALASGAISNESAAI